MREYKFRGKRIDNSEWVHGDILSGVGGGKYIVTLVDDVGTWQSNPRLLHAKVDPDTVGQYTGLKDKHGKEIYEGDILEEEPGYYFEAIWSVECAKFKLQWRTKAIQYPEWNRGVNMTVIGNRWDNPELLKEVESV